MKGYYVLYFIGVLYLTTSYLKAQDSTPPTNTETLASMNLESESNEFKLIRSAEFLTACGCGSSFDQADKTVSDNVVGFKVLEKGYQMAFIKKELIAGSCWDYVNAVYNRMGKEYQKTIILNTNKTEKKYADKTLLKPGDWIYHINYEYGGVEHSAIFVCWKDFEQGTAVTLSYAGRNKKQTARFGVYNLNGVYSIFRLKKKV